MNSLMSVLLSFLPHKTHAEINGKLPQVDLNRIKEDVRIISHPTKHRHYRNTRVLNETVEYIEKNFRQTAEKVEIMKFKVDDGTEYKNVIASFGPEEAPRFIIGAHYDVAGSQPGADDNASGVSAILEIARLLKEGKHKLTHRIDLVAFALEEPPFFGGDDMGSAHYARKLKKEKAQVKLMLALDMIGYFSEKPGSQNMPFPLQKLYPSTGNFIGVVGNLGHVAETRKIRKLMQEGSPELKVEILNAPASVPGVDLSDHRNFWTVDYPALMITDTAFYRNPNYHTSGDTIDTLDFTNMARVIQGLYYSSLFY